MRRISESQRDEITSLRKKGKSILEIVRITGSAQTTVQRYVRKIKVPSQYIMQLREKQGGAKDRAIFMRQRIMKEARDRLNIFSNRDALILLVGLYWGEGTKRDFSIINSDPLLIQAFIHCLETSLQIPRSRMSLSLRVHFGIDVKMAKKFWSQVTGIPVASIGRIEIIHGKKKGKLLYGMCRVRVGRGIQDRLRVQSLISLIGKECSTEVIS